MCFSGGSGMGLINSLPMIHRGLGPTFDIAGKILFGDKEKPAGGAGGAAMPGLPQPPQARSEMPDRSNFAADRGGMAPMDIPTFLGVNSSMTTQQQRSRLATLGTSGEYGSIGRPTSGPYAGKGVEDVARDYYRNIALMSLTGEDGSVLPGAEVLPVEQQYLRDVLGRTPKTGDPASFLSQLFG